MPRTASLPMYNLPEMRAINAAFWDALATLLPRDGVTDVPDALDFTRPPVPEAIGPEVLFTQTCGYPLQTIYRSQHTLLGVPQYDAPGCDAPEIAGPAHRALVVVRSDDPARALADLRGRVFACNSLHSNSGMNLPRRSLADLAGGKPMFRRVIISGGHPASMALVRDGEADATSIDNLTYTFFADHRPEAVHGLRVLAETVPSPAIPFVTSSATDPGTVAALRRGLQEVTDDPRHADACRALRLRSIAMPEGSDYTLLLRYEAEAAALGYRDLA